MNVRNSGMTLKKAMGRYEYATHFSSGKASKKSVRDISGSSRVNRTRGTLETISASNTPAIKMTRYMIEEVDLTGTLARCRLFSTGQDSVGTVRREDRLTYRNRERQKAECKNNQGDNADDNTHCAQRFHPLRLRMAHAEHHCQQHYVEKPAGAAMPQVP